MSEARLHELIHGWLQGTLSDAEFAELDAQLKNDATARQAFLRATNLDSALRDHASRDEHTSAWLPKPAPAPAWWSKWLMPAGIAAAAALVFGAYLAGGSHPRAAKPALEATAQGTAVLTQNIDAEWGASGQPNIGATLLPGKLQLKKGLAQIEFFSGAALVVSAPAEFEIVSPWKVIWHSGKARVKVPPAARGFEMSTASMKVIDLGTEFGLDVGGGSPGTRLQVFSGEVEAHPLVGSQMNLKEGQGIEQRGETIAALPRIQPDDFPSVDHVRELGRERAATRFAQWQAFSEKQRQDSRLVAYYVMQPDTAGQRLVRNIAQPTAALRDGGAVGAAWTSGRWPQKGALEFKGVGDRVRMQIDGQYNAITLMCWVRVDGLDRTLNAIMLTDGFEPGEPHWQIFQDGRIRFAVAQPNPGGEQPPPRSVYETPVVFDPSHAGHWRHLAVTYNAGTGEGIHYVDGVEVSRRTDTSTLPKLPITIGSAELGNWGMPPEGFKFAIRNLNGRIDEFAIYSSVLGADEIHTIYEAGKPE